MKKICCDDCRQELNNDTIAFNLRIRGMGIGSFYCLSCLALKMDCEASFLTTKLNQLKDGGCGFFTKQYLN